jgi:uncharacterized phage protein (TIGR01671 family)
MTSPKFRCWHKDEGRMFVPSKLLFSANGDLNNVREGIPAGEAILPDEIVLMQSTGLRDRNGVEIFEGDIVKQPMQSHVWRGDVVFEQGAFRIHEPYTEENPRIYNKDLIGGLAEVLGNVHQHPELLPR